MGQICKFLSMPCLLFAVISNIRWENNIRMIRVYISYRRGNNRTVVAANCFNSSYCPSVEGTVSIRCTNFRDVDYFTDRSNG